MSESKVSRLKLGHLFIEGVVVVASILIAFALDAWWDDRQLEEEMAEDLAIVEYELAENLRLTALTIELMERVIVFSQEIVTSLKTHSDDENVEIPAASLFWGLFNNPTLDPSLGGIDAWIAAGRMAGIESPELRQRLASVRGKVSDVTEEQFVARDISVRHIYPLIRDQIGDIAPIVELYASGFHGRQGVGVLRDIPDVGTVSVPNSKALRFDLQVRAIWYQASIQETRDFQSELEAIQSLLRDEMSK